MFPHLEDSTESFITRLLPPFSPITSCLQSLFRHELPKWSSLTFFVTFRSEAATLEPQVPDVVSAPSLVPSA